MGLNMFLSALGSSEDAQMERRDKRDQARRCTGV